MSNNLTFFMLHLQIWIIVIKIKLSVNILIKIFIFFYKSYIFDSLKLINAFN